MTSLFAGIKILGYNLHELTKLLEFLKRRHKSFRWLQEKMLEFTCEGIARGNIANLKKIEHSYSYSNHIDTKIRVTFQKRIVHTHIYITSWKLSQGSIAFYSYEKQVLMRANLLYLGILECLMLKKLSDILLMLQYTTSATTGTPLATNEMKQPGSKTVIGEPGTSK